MVIDIIRGHSKFALYGARVVAYGAYVAIKHLFGLAPECFVVSTLDGNPAEIAGLPVRPLDACALDAESTLVVIAVTEPLQDEIAAALQAKGYRHIFRLTAHEEHLLMSEYFASMGRFPLAEKSPGSDGDGDFALYEVRHHLDKPLRKRPGLRPREIPIQAGAELAGIRVCELRDNDGDNISHKNAQYCEASAMYSIWKNATAPWVGVEHYRRHLLVTPDMLYGDVDVIMPLPYMCYPDSESQFRRFVGEEVATALHDALKKLHPGEYEAYARCLSGEYHYAYNMIAARKEVFDKFCEWAFGITGYIERLDLRSVKETRALAYAAEQLTSIYFMANLDKLTIKHAEKEITLKELHGGQQKG
jgi:hypothetical protein